MRIIPRADLVYVIPIEDPERTRGGLYIPEQARQRADHGIVKYRGSKVEDLRVGDHVLFSGYSGTRIAVEGEDILLVMKEEDVLAILDEEDPAKTFTVDEFVRIAEKAHGDLKAMGVNDIDVLLERIKNYLGAHFYSEGLMF